MTITKRDVISDNKIFKLKKVFLFLKVLGFIEISFLLIFFFWLTFDNDLQIQRLKSIQKLHHTILATIVYV